MIGRRPAAVLMPGGDERLRTLPKKRNPFFLVIRVKPIPPRVPEQRSSNRTDLMNRSPLVFVAPISP